MGNTLLIMFITFAVLLFMQVPIAVTIGLSCLVFIQNSSAIQLTSFGTTMFTACDSFPLMAIPLFILTGSLMDGGGLARRLIDFAASIVGNFTGGYAMVAIVTCAFFGAISGSALATVAAIGGIIIPVMVEKGYDKKFCYGLICGAGCLGIIIPPSIPMVMYASATDVSIGALFLGGFGPGLSLTAILLVTAYFMCKKRGYTGNGVPFSFKNVFTALKGAIWAIIIPVIILGGIYGGFFTPTEAAAVAVVYSAFAGRFIYKELTLKKLVDAIGVTAITNGTILIVCGTATMFGRVLTISQVPGVIVGQLTNFTSSPIVLLMIVNVVFLIVGCFMETNSAILILAPMLMPLIKAYGIHPVHFGLIVVLNLAIGLCTPPVGANLFVATGMSGLPFNTITKSVLPFLAALLVALIFITYVPQITLFLPQVFGLIK